MLGSEGGFISYGKPSGGRSLYQSCFLSMSLIIFYFPSLALIVVGNFLTAGSLRDVSTDCKRKFIRQVTVYPCVHVSDHLLCPFV